MRVLYFGTYERRYPRNAQVISSLRRAGVEVRERHESVWDADEHKWNAGLAAAARLARAELRLLTRPGAGAADAVLVGYPGHLDLLAARRAAGKRPLVFNPLVSLVDTLVHDRGRFGARSPAARALEVLDRRALRAADLVVADTAANAEYLAELAHLDETRIAVCFVGAEERLFAPRGTPTENGPVLFVGKLIPLHGVETVLAAARRAPDVLFRAVGSGQLEGPLRDRPANVDWVRWIDYERLPGELRAARVALGVFGTSSKARRVIPNKAFQALACGVPLVTADTPAARELLVDGESALLVPPGDPEALAAAVRRLVGDPDVAARIGRGGLAAYHAHASEDVLGRRWRGLLEKLLG